MLTADEVLAARADCQLVGWSEGLTPGVFWPQYDNDTHTYQNRIRVDTVIWSWPYYWSKLTIRYGTDGNAQTTWALIEKVMP